MQSLITGIYATTTKVVNMASKVAIVEVGQDPKQAFKQALDLIGGIGDLNTKDRQVVVKVGVFDHRTSHHTTVDVASAIIDSFDKAPKIFLAESDNYRGTGIERLQIWKKLFSNRVIPFNLSEDTDIRTVKIVDEKIGLSHILFKPNTLVSTHILRTYDKGSVIKNLFGLTPDKKKAKYHKKGVENVILDIYEAIEGIDLAVLDGTHVSLSATPKAKQIKTNILVVGRDAVAVETVGFAIVGVNPENILLIQEAKKRGLGEGDLSKIEVVGYPIESAKARIVPLLKEAKKQKTHAKKPKPFTH